MNRRPFICGNWKMFKNHEETCAFFEELCSKTSNIKDRDILIAPVSIYLTNALEIAKGSDILVCAQNVHYMEEGAYTGEISPLQLKDINCRWTLIGHSERRKYFHENDEIVNLKTRSALKAGINPIVCIGETAEERKVDRTFDVIARSIKNTFHLLDINDAEKITIAYEPVWAIGTGLTATPEIAQEVHSFIRQTIAGIYNTDIHHKIRILYGGSVKSSNIKGLMEMDDIDGVLVGGASLKIDEFIKIITFDS